MRQPAPRPRRPALTPWQGSASAKFRAAADRPTAGGCRELLDPEIRNSLLFDELVECRGFQILDEVLQCVDQGFDRDRRDARDRRFEQVIRASAPNHAGTGKDG